MLPAELRRRAYGHNLVALLEEALARGLRASVPLEPIEEGVIRLLNFDYAAKRFEYRVTGGTYYLPLIDVTERIAGKLLTSTQEET